VKINSLLVPGCALLLHAGAQAQAHSPDDPAAAVPPAAYRSVFTPASGSLPAEPGDWRRLNAEVGQFRNGHVDIIKWEAGHAPGTPDASGVPATASPPAPPAPPARGRNHPHGQHGGHSSHANHPPGSKP